MDEYYLCPFCAFRGRIIDFRVIKLTGGYSRKTFQCPCCMNRMHEKTLKRNMTIEEWAEWMYLSIRTFNKPNNSFYGRIVWLKLFANLKILGFETSTRFWNAWREIKAIYYDLDADTIHEKIDAGRDRVDHLKHPLTQWIFTKCPICDATINDENIMKVYMEFESKEYIDGCFKCSEKEVIKWRSAFIRSDVTT